MSGGRVQALIYAAGLGTRLRPLTEHLPKALVEVGGRPLLEIVARRLVAAGATRLVVNVCPHAEQIERFAATGRLGAPYRISREPGEPLETGGGLWHAAPLFARAEPLLLHNVDVLSDVPLAALMDAHLSAQALVTLAVMDRPTKRRLLFDDVGLLGRVDEDRQVDLRVRPARGPLVALGFAGIHAAAPALLERITERGRFSILDTYLRLAAEGARLVPYRIDACRWIDVGRPQDLERAQSMGLAQPS